jgi:hypothetical protein
VILLDTDHVNVLKYPDHPRFARLTTQLNTSADQDIATTVITVEERMRGWLAWTNRSDDVRRQVSAYKELIRLFDFFTRWHVVPLDEQGLLTQKRLSIMIVTHKIIKKTLRLDPEKLAQLQKLFNTSSEAEAVRQAIDETLAYSEALQAARRIQRRGTFGHHED